MASKRYFIYYQTAVSFPGDLKFLKRTMADSRLKAVMNSREALRGKRAKHVIALSQAEVDKMRNPFSR